jgi:hypothetical protein
VLVALPAIFVVLGFVDVMERKSGAMYIFSDVNVPRERAVVFVVRRRRSAAMLIELGSKNSFFRLILNPDHS